MSESTLKAPLTFSTVLIDQEPHLFRFVIFPIDFAQSTEELDDTSGIVAQKMTDQTATLDDNNTLSQSPDSLHIEVVIRSILRDSVVPDEDNFEELQQLIEVHDNAALDAITALIMHDELDEEISWELLQFLGELNHPSTNQYRYWLLKRMLKSGSHWKRDGASLGLDLMDNPEASISIKQAIEKEQIRALRLSMEKVLARLESRK